MPSTECSDHLHSASLSNTHTPQDWADVASRDAAAPVLEQLMALQPGTALEENVTRLDDAGMPLAGDGGDHAFEGAVATLALAVAGGPGTAFVQHMLSGVSRLAAVAGVPSEPLLLGGSEIDGAHRQTRCIWSQIVRHCVRALTLQPPCDARGPADMKNITKRRDVCCALAGPAPHTLQRPTTPRATQSRVLRLPRFSSAFHTFACCWSTCPAGVACCLAMAAATPPQT